MSDKQIYLSAEFKTRFPEYRNISIQADVVNRGQDEELWREMQDASATIRTTITIDDIKHIPAIAATRNAYKRSGKDPNRYRPSAEALMRRIVKGEELYRISVLVDLINHVSIRTGYSIGGFDASKICGDVTIGIGRHEEKFEAIGRGVLNIENLPLLRDDKGGIGTPTSDEERTKLTPDTTEILIVINGYSGEEGLQEAADMTCSLLRKYASAANIRQQRCV